MCRLGPHVCFQTHVARVMLKHSTLQWKRGVPVEVIPMAYSPVMLAMRDLGLTPVLRMAKEKAVCIFAGV